MPTFHSLSPPARLSPAGRLDRLRHALDDVSGRLAESIADAAAQARVRETFAQFVPGEAKKPEPQVQRKRKVAKRQAPPMQFAQPPQMRVAQQSHFGFFGGPSWNNTW